MKFDVIVIGVGSMGAAACYQLAKRGKRVLGLEQFDITHELGSHTGQSRLIRKAYFEHPDYVPLLKRAYEGWREIEEESQKQLYWETGIAYFAPQDHPIIEGVRSSAKTHNIRLNNLSYDQCTPFTIPSNFARILEPEAGFLTPEPAICSFCEAAQDYGAIIHANESVQGFKETPKGVVVETNKTSYTCSKLIISAGAYTADLIDLKIPLKVTRQLLAWANPKSEQEYGLGQMPCWMVAELDMEGLYYGFPSLPEHFYGPSGMKVAYHRPGEVLHDAKETQFEASQEKALLSSVLNKYLPDAQAEITEIKQCRYTYSPDEHFIVDELRAYGNKVIVAAGFSGHGFKFVPIMGEVLADLVIEGNTKWPVEFLKMNRFK